jgi:aspartyl-tRNA(Asn)/glutamyl-tRNA(Gln) amidotransferase subunit C
MADAPVPPTPPPALAFTASPARLDVQHVAKLASLTLTDVEAARLETELAAIVAYVAQLEQADTRDVAPTAHVQLDRMPLRQDVVLPCLSHEDALSQAPSVDAEGFAVPTFVE